MAWVVLGVAQMSLNPAPPMVNEFKGTNAPTTRGYVGFMIHGGLEEEMGNK